LHRQAGTTVVAGGLPGRRERGRRERRMGPFLVDPRTRARAITLTFDQFKYSWANALDEKEAKELYDKFHVARSGIALVQMGNANLNPWTAAKDRPRRASRGCGRGRSHPRAGRAPTR
jgi:hypothetical protein